MTHPVIYDHQLSHDQNLGHVIWTEPYWTMATEQTPKMMLEVR